MLKTTHRPPATPCGGLNALYPLHRNCQVVSDVCAPGDETPIGVWFDGHNIYWEQGKSLTAFGLPVLSHEAAQTFEADNPGAHISTDFDVMLPRDVETAQPFWFTIIDDGESPTGPVSGWEHYFQASVAHYIGAGVDQAYALDGVPTKIGLAALTNTGAPFGEDPLELPVIGAVVLPRWIPDHNVTYNVRDMYTNELYSTHTGALVSHHMQDSYFYLAELRQITGDEPTLGSTRYIELVTESSIYMQGWRSFSVYKIPEQV